MSKVYLVGAGPGAADLLTLRAMRILQVADVVLYDALVSAEVLQFAKPLARLINVGKRCGRKLFAQEEIHSLLIEMAKQGETVVRLKGGDPMIFGRASEEMNALRAAGVDFEVVPGVTAACSAAAAARISLTNRRASSQVLLTTAQHCAERNNAPFIDAAQQGQTLVIYMPGQNYDQIQEQLRAAGFADTVPCMIVSRIASGDEEVLATDVASLASVAPLAAPAVLIVGEVARGNANEAPSRFARISVPDTAVAEVEW
ncbi:MAG: uroporphyrinogen-III C-methyltransferase [Acidobacteriaceae bacterium]